MIRVLFLCHGNICRSPMAEFILKDMVSARGIADQFDIASAATSREEIGNPVYPPAVRELARHGISAAGKTARQLRREDYDRYDYLLAMEAYNLPNAMGISSGLGIHVFVLLWFVFSHCPIIAICFETCQDIFFYTEKNSRGTCCVRLGRFAFCHILCYPILGAASNGRRLALSRRGQLLALFSLVERGAAR